jgi:hypothetical protein
VTEGGRSLEGKPDVSDLDANHPQSINWEFIDYSYHRLQATLGELAHIHQIPLDVLRRRYSGESAVSDRYRAWIRGMDCCLFACYELAEPHHALPKGAGGKDWQIVPMCHGHHMECHQIGHDTFEEKYKISLLLIAEILYGAWRKPRPPAEAP